MRCHTGAELRLGCSLLLTKNFDLEVVYRISGAGFFVVAVADWLFIFLGDLIPSNVFTVTVVLALCLRC